VKKVKELLTSSLVLNIADPNENLFLGISSRDYDFRVSN
jgi:hypothetical protein